MNLRNVLRAYSLLRQFTDDESAMLETLRRATDAERALLVETLSDKPQKKSSKKSAGGGGRKSARSESLKQQISGRGQSLVQPPATATTDDSSDSTHTRCQFTRADGKLCLLLPDHNIHHLQTAMDYHEFVVGKSDAQSAAGGS